MGLRIKNEKISNEARLVCAFCNTERDKGVTPLCTGKCVLINYTETLVNLNSKPLQGLESMMKRIGFHLKGF